ncbi:hypothetical protein K505DRAFT_380261 [Melanomma pulvis-pyrius CBS 109.77]|uniref:DUF6594 domain-containing protein n=1 Tax=Melanomma pulvis-pyrius CBS 109.77 TaxID=1314802 RepID=A0A6A6WQU9_9PLEO|nr:hypothetical protein K505DRAFT_380261 [Melanomma pulvis-pyrius CBS 109.77]
MASIPKYQFSRLYEDFALSPERARLRRYVKEATWMIYGQQAEIQILIDECNAIIKKKDNAGSGSGKVVLTVTDLHHPDMYEAYPGLSEKVQLLRKKIRRHNKDACHAHTIAQYPIQSSVYSKNLLTYGLCKVGKFLPTGEDEKYYQHPPHPDTFALKDVSGLDPLTEFIVNNIESWARRFVKTKEYDEEENEIDPEFEVRNGGIRLAAIEAVVNSFTSLYAPVLFTASIAILYCIQSTKNRIVVAGVLGMILAASAQLLIPGVKRGEVFAITAAYFAIAGVYIGSIDNVGG